MKSLMLYLLFSISSDPGKYSNARITAASSPKSNHCLRIKLKAELSASNRAITKALIAMNGLLKIVMF